MAILLGLFLLVPFGLERSSAIVPTTSADPAPPTPGPQTWVLSSTVAIPGPVTVGAEAERDLDGAPDTGKDGGGGSGSASMIIRVPVPGPTSEPGAVSSTAAPYSTAPPSTRQHSGGPHSAAPSSATPLPSATIAPSSSTCPQPTPAGVAPRIAQKLGGDLGSTSGGGDDAYGADCAG